MPCYRSGKDLKEKNKTLEENPGLEVCTNNQVEIVKQKQTVPTLYWRWNMMAKSSPSRPLS